jgi:DNA gyrase subunit A
MREGDELIDTKLTDGTKEIVLATKNGRAIRFDESDVRPTGRPAHGVIGIRLYEGDEVVSMAVVTSDSKLLTLTENGYGKVSIVGKWETVEGPAPEEEEIVEAEPEGKEPIEEKEERDEYRKTRRGGRGVKALRVTERNGRVLAVLEVGDDDGIIIASDAGNVMRTSVSDFRVTSRVTMGVRAKRLEEGEKVIAVQRLVGEKDMEAVAEVEVKEDGSILPAEDKDNGTDQRKDRCEDGGK